MHPLIVIFISVFVAEVGDKTQLATMLFATDGSIRKIDVFLVSSLALVASTFLAVVAGEFITRFIPAPTLKIVAGVGFLVVGVWTLISAGR